MSGRDWDKTFAAVVDLAVEAGRAIMEVYSSPFAVETKADNSPLTQADKRAHDVIAAGLSKLTPDLHVLSEEGRDIPFDERKGWGEYWMVDPLDGTKEFVKRNGQFTVNIALIRDGRTRWGVVHAPALNVTYWGGPGLGAFKVEGVAQAVRVSVKSPSPKGLVVVKSISHPSPELESFLDGLSIADSISVGSSLKFCAVAEGSAHLYARFGPTMEWDTAAGQAVLEGAGGSMTTPGGELFTYNKPSLKNGNFIASFGEFNVR